MQTQTPTWTDLCAVAEVPADGSGKYVLLGRRAIAVFRHGDEIRVMDDACPHAGASLSAGRVHDGCVVCPWHGWAFDARSGRCPDNTDIAVRTYAVRLVDGRVQAQL